MSHPFDEHRQTKVEHSRVGHITKAYAKGGAVKHSDEKQDRKLVKSMIDKAIHPEGKKAKHRMDRPHRAKGGRVKKGNAKTIVNVITGGHPAAGAVPPGPPMVPPPAPPMGVAPAGMAPPMGAKPPMMPPPGAGGPPGMPMRAKGGRIRKADGGDVSDATREEGKNRLGRQMNYDRAQGRKWQDVDMADAKNIDYLVRRDRAKGGRVQTPSGSGTAEDSGTSRKTGGSPVFNASTRNGTQVSHDDGKGDLKDIGRGKPITFKSGGRVRHFYAKGGKVESPEGIAPATKMPGGGGGGKGRLFKEHRAERDYAKPAR